MKMKGISIRHSARDLLLCSLLFCSISSGHLWALNWLPDAQTGNWMDTGVWNGSTYTINNSIFIDNGTINESGGNTVDGGTGDFYFGNSGGSQAYINFSGANLSTDRIYLGVAGNAVLTATSGSNITTTNTSSVFRIGSDFGSSGNLSLTDSYLNSYSIIYVGFDGDASFRMKNSQYSSLGASSGGLRFGYRTGSTSNVIIEDSTLDLGTNPIYFGDSGSSNGTIKNTEILANDIRIGSGTGGSGYVSMDNVSMINTNGVNLASGSGSSGSMSFTNGSNLFSSTGAWNASAGVNSDFELTLSDSSFNLSTNDFTIANGTNSSFLATISNSTLTGISTMRLGRYGSGNFVITNSSLDFSFNSYYGDLLGSHGSSSITDSTIDYNGNLVYLGNSGNGTGLFTNSTLTDLGGFIVAHYGTSTASASMDNVISSYPTETFVVGNSGNGTLNISNNSQLNLSLTQNLSVGNGSGSAGHFSLTDSSMTLNGKNCYFGYNGNAEVTLSNSNFVGAGRIYIADRDGSDATLLVSNVSGFTANNIYIANIGSTSSANVTFTNTDIDMNNTSIEIGDSGTAYTSFSNSTISNLLNFTVNDGSTGNAYCRIDNMILGSAIQQFTVGDNNALLEISDSTLSFSSSGQLRVGIEAGGTGNMMVTDSTMNLNGKDCYFGFNGNAEVALSNSTFAGAGRIYIADRDGSDATLLVSNVSGFTANNIYIANTGSTSSANVTFTNTDIDMNNTSIEIGDVGSASISFSNSTISNLLHFQVNNGSTGYAYCSMDNMILGSAIQQFNVGDNNALLEITDSTLSFSSASTFSIGDIAGATGNVIVTNSTMAMNGKSLYVGRLGSAYLTINDSTFSNINDLYVVDSSTTESANLIFNGGNVDINGHFRIRQPGTMMRIVGGSSNLTCNTFITSSDTIWEHMINRHQGTYDQMGSVYIESDTTEAEGHLKIGVEGGSAFCSGNYFYLQTGTSNGALNYLTYPSDMYDIVLASNIDGGTRGGVKAYFSSANLVSSLDFGANGYATYAGNVAAGYVSVANLRSYDQRHGLYVHMKINSGSVANIISDLIAAGYVAELSDFEDYDLKYHVIPTDVPAGTGYAVWDFRNISTGVSYATLEKIIVTPVAYGSIFRIE